MILILTHLLRLTHNLRLIVKLKLTHLLTLKLSSTQTVMLTLMHSLKQRLNLTPTVMLTLMRSPKQRLNLTPTVMHSLKHLLKHFQEDFLRYSLKGMLMLSLIEKEKMRQPLTQMLKLMQILPYLLIQIETLLLKYFLRCFEMYLKMHWLYLLQTLTR